MEAESKRAGVPRDRDGARAEPGKLRGELLGQDREGRSALIALDDMVRDLGRITVGARAKADVQAVVRGIYGKPAVGYYDAVNAKVAPWLAGELRPGYLVPERLLVPDTRQAGPPSTYKRTISRPSAVTAMCPLLSVKRCSRAADPCKAGPPDARSLRSRHEPTRRSEKRPRDALLDSVSNPISPGKSPLNH